MCSLICFHKFKFINVKLKIKLYTFTIRNLKKKSQRKKMNLFNVRKKIEDDHLKTRVEITSLRSG